MMSLTFGLFNQVSGLGPLGPLVFFLFGGWGGGGGGGGGGRGGEIILEEKKHIKVELNKTDVHILGE